MAHELLPAALTIYEAQATQSVLLAALSASQPENGALEIDLSQVSDFDGAGLQLMLAVERAARQRGQQVSLLQAPPCVVRILEEFDLLCRFLLTHGSRDQTSSHVIHHGASA